jgi:hypothetical protein
VFEEFDPEVFVYPPRFSYSKKLTSSQDRKLRRKRRRYRLRKLKRAMIRAGLLTKAS